MFAYCLNKPINMVDSLGTDAVYVVGYEIDENGLPVVGHAYLFIQDSKGEWYLVQYTGTFPDKSSAHVKVTKVTSGLFKEILDKILSEQEIDGTNYTYYEGDFTESLDLANELNETNLGGYNLLFNNCLHFAKAMLSKGTFDSIEEKLSLKLSGTCIPGMFQYSAGIVSIAYDFRKEVIAVGQKVEESFRKWLGW